MDNDMAEYGKVLQYLRETHVDRVYACEFKDIIKEVDTDIDCELVSEYSTDFDNSYKLSNITTGSSIRINLPFPQDYVDTDTFEVLFYSETELTPSDIDIGFSNVKNGVVDNFSLNKDNLITDESIIGVGYNLFKYRIRDTNTKMQKKNRKVSAVSCVNIYFKVDIDEVYLTNLVFRVHNYNYTLEDIDDHILAGQHYIMNALKLPSIDLIPQPLIHLSYKAAAAYNWMIWFENEAKTMDDGTREGRNYATRLFDQIDMFIEKFIEVNPEYGQDTINMKLVGYTTYCEYPIKRCKKKHRR